MMNMLPKNVYDDPGGMRSAPISDIQGKRTTDKGRGNKLPL